MKKLDFSSKAEKKAQETKEAQERVTIEGIFSGILEENFETEKFVDMIYDCVKNPNDYSPEVKELCKWLFWIIESYKEETLKQDLANIVERFSQVVRSSPLSKELETADNLSLILLEVQNGINFASEKAKNLVNNPVNNQVDNILQA